MLNWAIGIDMYTLMCIKLMTNKNLLYKKLNKIKFKHFKKIFHFKKSVVWGFPGGTVDKNQPANAGDTGSSSGPGRSHMLQSN